MIQNKTLQDLKEKRDRDLETAETSFERNLINSEFEHAKKLLGLMERGELKDKPDDQDIECIGCGS